jgi:IclR family KDG regulon transcriptional repressor
MTLENAVSVSDDADADRGSVKSLVKALDLLETVAKAAVPPRIVDVAIASGISRPTAYRIVQTLAAKGYLAQDAQSGRLSPGFSLLMLSAGLLDRNRLRIEALPHLQSLANLTGERTNLGILHRNKVLYLAGVEKPSLPTIYSRFGKSAPAHCCSLGKAILAHLPQQELQELLAAEPLCAETPNSITSMPRFLEELELTRQRGYAIDEGEHQENACCIATTIFSQSRAVGAIGVSAPKLEPLINHISVLRHTAELISHVL